MPGARHRAADHAFGHCGHADALIAAVPDEVLKAALLSLPLPFRSVVLLADVEGYSYKEIARTLEVPIGTVMSRLSRARRTLREAIEASRGANAGRA